jgi:hypothetical protein
MYCGFRSGFDMHAQSLGNEDTGIRLRAAQHDDCWLSHARSFACLEQAAIHNTVGRGRDRVALDIYRRNVKFGFSLSHLMFGLREFFHGCAGEQFLQLCTPQLVVRIGCIEVGDCSVEKFRCSQSTVVYLANPVRFTSAELQFLHSTFKRGAGGYDLFTARSAKQFIQACAGL